MAMGSGREVKSATVEVQRSESVSINYLLSSISKKKRNISIVLKHAQSILHVCILWLWLGTRCGR